MRCIPQRLARARPDLLESNIVLSFRNPKRPPERVTWQRLKADPRLMLKRMGTQLTAIAGMIYASFCQEFQSWRAVLCGLVDCHWDFSHASRQRSAVAKDAPPLNSLSPFLRLCDHSEGIDGPPLHKLDLAAASRLRSQHMRSSEW